MRNNCLYFPWIQWKNKALPILRRLANVSIGFSRVGHPTTTITLSPYPVSGWVRPRTLRDNARNMTAFKIYNFCKCGPVFVDVYFPILHILLYFNFLSSQTSRYFTSFGILKSLPQIVYFHKKQHSSFSQINIFRLY